MKPNLYIKYVRVPEKNEDGQFCVIFLPPLEVVIMSCSECYWPSNFVNLFLFYNKLIYIGGCIIQNEANSPLF